MHTSHASGEHRITLPPESRPTAPPNAAEADAIEAYERDVREMGETMARLKWLGSVFGAK